MPLDNTSHICIMTFSHLRSESIWGRVLRQMLGCLVEKRIGSLDNQGSFQKIDPLQLFDFLYRLSKEMDAVSKFVV